MFGFDVVEVGDLGDLEVRVRDRLGRKEGEVFLVETVKSEDGGESESIDNLAINDETNTRYTLAMQGSWIGLGWELRRGLRRFVRGSRRRAGSTSTRTER